jgi:hypothetical protein
MKMNLFSPISWRLGPLVSAAAGMLLLGGAQAGAQVLFFDDFSGPSLSPAWHASLPSATITGPPPGSYVGAPTYAFQSLGGASVLRMNETLNSYTRAGWSTTSSFSGSSFRYEARFNTLTQSSTTSIDAFFELWVFDPSNPSRYDKFCPFGGSFGDNRELAWSSSIDNASGLVPFGYQNNTWYRLVIQGGVGQNIRLSVDNDSGTELFGQTLNHGFGTYGSGIDLAISQAMGSAAAGPSDVAVDWVRLSQVPEPGAATLLACALAGGLVLGRRRQKQTELGC